MGLKGKFKMRAPTIKEPEPEPPKPATIEERRKAFAAVLAAIDGAMLVLEAKDQLDRSLAEGLVGTSRNLSVRMQYEARIAGLAKVAALEEALAPAKAPEPAEGRA